VLAGRKSEFFLAHAIRFLLTALISLLLLAACGTTSPKAATSNTLAPTETPLSTATPLPTVMQCTIPTETNTPTATD